MTHAICGVPVRRALPPCSHPETVNVYPHSRRPVEISRQFDGTGVVRYHVQCLVCQMMVRYVEAWVRL